MICPNCKNPYLPGQKFCKSCGSKLEGLAPSPAAPINAQQPPNTAYTNPSAGSRMRKAHEVEFKIHGEDIPVRAKVESISGFSGHGDYNEILAWLMGFNRKPEKTFIVHGEPEARESMAEKIRQRFGWEVIVPALGDQAELDL